VDPAAVVVALVEPVEMARELPMPLLREVQEVLVLPQQ
jgi:hypothetical protein